MFNKLAISTVFAAAIILISISIYIIIYTTTPVHYWDQWEMVKHIANGGGPSLSYLFNKHNEHIIFTSKILFFIDYYLFDYSNVALVCVIVALQAAIGFCLARIATGGDRGSLWLLSVVFSAIMLSLSQWENLTIGFQTQFGLTALFAIFVCSATQQYLTSRGMLNRSLIFVFLSTAATILSMGNGIAIIVSQVILLVANRAAWSKALLVCLAYVLPMAVFLQGGSGAQAASILDKPHIFAILKFLLAVLGSSFSSSYDFAAAYGTIVFATFALLAIIYGLISPLVKARVDPQTLTLVAIGAFPIMSAFAVTYGRYKLGDVAALSSRYSALNLLLCCCVIGLIYRIGPPARAGRTAIACGVLGILIAGMTSIRTDNIVQLENRSNVLRQASYFVLMGARNDRTLKALYPDPAAIRPALDYLQDHRLNIFSEEYGLAVPVAASTSELMGLPTCTGVSISETTRLEQNSWAISGSIDAKSDMSDTAWLLAITEDGKVTGFAPPSLQWRGWRGLTSSRAYVFHLPVQINGRGDGKITTVVLLRDNGEGCRLRDPISLPRLYFQSQVPGPTINLQADLQQSFDRSGAVLPSVLHGIQSLQMSGMLSTWQGSDENIGSITYVLRPEADGRCRDAFVGVMRGPTSEGIRLEVHDDAGFSEVKNLDELLPHSWAWIKVRDHDSCSGNSQTVVSLIDDGKGWGAWAAIAPPVGTSR